MSINYVDYEVLETGIQVYGAQAEAVQTVLKSLNTMNENLAEGWQNDTSRAFIEKFNEVHGPALMEVVKALEGIAQSINNYMTNRQEEDQSGAASIRG